MCKFAAISVESKVLCYMTACMVLCRPMRPLEVEGKDYFFVTKEKFETWIAEKQLLEHALVYGDYKGIPRQQVHPQI